MQPPLDLAQVRLDNALLLFDDFVRQAASQPDAATLRGLERRFAERLQIQPSYWSQLKSRARQIGERLARQFEQLSHKPYGWMDVPHPRGGQPPAPSSATGDVPVPTDDDERFIVGLVLTYYRRHPQRARSRLLELLGEALVETEASPPPEPAAKRSAGGVSGEDAQLWHAAHKGVAPLKRKR